MVATTNPALTTLPDAAVRLGLNLDSLRSKVRRDESRLVTLGLVVRAGRYRLLVADRLEELKRELAAE